MTETTVASIRPTTLNTDLALSTLTTPFPQLYAGKILPPKLMLMAVKMAKRSGISLQDMRGPSHERCYSWPRQDFMREARNAGYSYPRIARFLDRDHTTIIHGVKQSEARLIAQEEG